MQTTEAPNIFSFTDYRVYLGAYYQWRKTKGKFSHAVFAKDAGLKSRSYLRLVLTHKRNLTLETIEKFSLALRLTRNEASAFKALVNFNQAGDFKERQKHWEQFLAFNTNPSEGIKKIKDVYSYLARMSYPVLLALLRQTQIKRDLNTLSIMTGMSLDQVNEGLSTLCDLGVIEKRPNNEYFATNRGLLTSNDVPNIAIQTFHMNMLKKAQECTSLPVNERSYQTALIPLGEEEYLFVKEKMRELALEVEKKFGGDRPSAKKIYALNLNLIPMTPDFIREDSKLTSQKSSEVSNHKEVHL